MQNSQNKQITDIVNAFRLVNKDIRESFKIMCDKLESSQGKGFETWKKWEEGNKGAKEDYRDYTQFFNGKDWYYLNCYGLYKKKVIGFSFIVSIDYKEETDEDYLNFLQKLDKNINPNTPMLCILGIYDPINKDNIKFLDEYGFHYVESILQFTNDWKNYEVEKIKYDEWIDVEIDYEDENGKVKEGYEGWYKQAKVKIKNITDISSKEEADKIIDDLLKCKI